ncbi:MAG: formylglycine-generating enzyme family protein, partial [Chloroflexi bacterium]|nr:formylglycine-generating enzyme family protein [Chloroflexota bacterium]
LAAAGALTLWVAPQWGRAQLARQLEMAEGGGNWGEALDACLAHSGLLGAQPALLGRCDQAARRLADGMGKAMEPSQAAAAIRALAAWGDDDTLAEALDRSRVSVPAGEFVMGSDDGRDNEKPMHRVYLDSYAIGRFEVSNAQYARFMRATGQGAPKYWAGGEYPAGQGDVAVVGVMWEQAQAYCQWMGGRLPTEAEWEKACRGEAARVYPWGDAWDATRANVSLGSEPVTGTFLSDLYPTLQVPPASGAPGVRPVGSYPQGASAIGGLDFVGNAAEWVADWYNWDGYWDMAAINPLGEGPEWNRSVRGSGWYFRMGMDDEVALWSRCAARNSSHASIDPRVGFRCAYPHG